MSFLAPMPIGPEDELETARPRPKSASNQVVPGVSVIIPTMNRAGLLKSAISSVLAQTYDQFEVIVVDDGSTDETPTLVRDIGDARVRYLRNERSLGSSNARNRGIEAANADFLAFLDDDDEWLPNKLELQLERFAEVADSVGVMYCGVIYVDSATGNELGRATPRYRGHVYDRLLDDMSGPKTPAAVVRRRCFQEIGVFDEGFPFHEEIDLWIRIARVFAFDFVDDCLVRVRRTHSNKLSTDDLAQIVGSERFLARYGDTMSRRYRAGYMTRIGNSYCHLGNMSKGRQYLRSAIRSQPKEIKLYTYWLSSWLPSPVYRGVRRLKQVVQPVLPAGW